MIYTEGFRNPQVAKALIASIHKLVEGYQGSMTLMEVCGTHTMAIYQHGIRSLLPEQIKLTSGPGCPVCVTTIEYVDHAVALSRRPDTIITTFGDMIRVPGSSSNLLREKAVGADIRIVYSTLDALKIAIDNPDKQIVFLGVGFETTTPTIAGSILEAERKGVDNYFVLAAHKTMPEPMEALSVDPDLQIDGYICPAHVSAIIGSNAYQPLVDKYSIPCVITGFESLDVLQGIEMLAKQIIEKRACVQTQYSRIVKPEGNIKAQAILTKVFEPADAAWRGIGVIPDSGLSIRNEYKKYNAALQLPVEIETPIEHAGCLCGDILKGKTSPLDCPLFAKACTPETPVGACMVSSEGCCAAEYKYGDRKDN